MAIHDSESEEFARQLFTQMQIKRNVKGVWIHSDNGNPMKGATLPYTAIQVLDMYPRSSRLHKGDDYLAPKGFYLQHKQHYAASRAILIRVF